MLAPGLIGANAPNDADCHLNYAALSCCTTTATEYAVIVKFLSLRAGGLIECVTLDPGPKRGQIDATLHGELRTILDWIERQHAGKGSHLV